MSAYSYDVTPDGSVNAYPPGVKLPSYYDDPLQLRVKPIMAYDVDTGQLSPTKMIALCVAVFDPHRDEECSVVIPWGLFTQRNHPDIFGEYEAQAAIMDLLDAGVHSSVKRLQGGLESILFQYAAESQRRRS